MCKYTKIIFTTAGAIEVDKISLTSVGGPPSDISDRSINPDAASLASAGAAGSLLGDTSITGSPQVGAPPATAAVSPTPPVTSNITSNTGRKKRLPNTIPNIPS